MLPDYSTCPDLLALRWCYETYTWVPRYGSKPAAAPRLSTGDPDEEVIDYTAWEAAQEHRWEARREVD